MSYAFTKLEGASLAAVNEATREIIGMALKELRLPLDGLTIRTLRAQDLGLSNANWTFNLGSFSIYSIKKTGF